MVKAFFKAFKDKDFQALLFLSAVILLSGTMFYSSVEGFSHLDAFYFSVVTLTTVGDANLAPVTDFGKVFTVLYLFTGIGIIFGFIRIIANHIRDRK